MAQKKLPNQIQGYGPAIWFCSTLSSSYDILYLMNYFTEFGRLVVLPEKEYKEIHQADKITIKIFKTDKGFFFSINCRLGRFIRAYYPHNDTAPYPTEYKAREAASQQIKTWVSGNRDAKKRLLPFDILEYRQIEFDF